MWDFREKAPEVYEPTLTLAERLALVAAQREAEVEASESAALPTQDAIYHPKDWPLEARVWFYRAGINNDDIALMGAFWNARMRRLVVPYRTISGDHAWIARDAAWKKGDARPKYLFPEGVSRGGGALFPAFAQGDGAGIVIVEDVLSAYRVARDTDLDAVAAQGTSLDRSALVRISEHRGPVFTWLDPDRYGQIGAAAIRRQLGNMGVDVRNVVSEMDPKLHEPHEIREALEI